MVALYVPQPTSTQFHPKTRFLSHRLQAPASYNLHTQRALNNVRRRTRGLSLELELLSTHVHFYGSLNTALPMTSEAHSGPKVSQPVSKVY
jgi:hypothetical protein